METALNGLSSTVKHSATKEAIQVAKESLKSFKENKDVPAFHVREKLLTAFELALDNGNEKHSYFAVDGIQILLRDQTYHDSNIEEIQNNLTSQILHTLTGIDEFKGQLQCKCITLLVEMICSNELKVSLNDVEECVQIYKRLYGKCEEERVRVACRAATTQSLTAYFSNRYGVCDAAQDSIAVYMDVCKLIEELCSEVEQMSSSHEQCLISLDSICALLTTSNLKILQHQPFVNLLWEKLCPLIILLLGIPTGSSTSASSITSKPSTDRTSDDDNNSRTISTTSMTTTVLGEGSIDFALAPAISANPHTWRALYQIVDQLIRLMIHDQNLTSSLEALFHKAFLYPRIDQRGEALKLIKKILGDGSKISKIAKRCVINKSLSLWRMLITCIGECSNPQLELSVDAVRTVVNMLDGLKQLSIHRFFTDEERDVITDMFKSVDDTIVNSFTCEKKSSNNETGSSTIIEESNEEVFEDDEMSQKLKRLEQKFNSTTSALPISQKSRRSSEFDESSERNTAKKFVENLIENFDDIMNLKSTLAIDEAILQFASNFYNNFCLVHADAYKNRCKIQQEFLNTDAIYLTTYASLTYFSRPNSFKLDDLKNIALSSGCVIHVANGWIEKVFENLENVTQKLKINGLLRDVINDFDGQTKGLLSDVEKLKRIQIGRSEQESSMDEEKHVARWLTSSAWQTIIDILSTFLTAKGKSREREKIREAISISICGMRGLVGVAQVLGLESRCGWIFEQLVETSCCLEDLRDDAAAADNQQKSTCTSREHLLAMQLVLDEARIAIHSPSCWKHIVRCTEYVWELEKYIYGALCYEKPSRLKFLRRRTEEKDEEKDGEKGTNAGDMSIENAIGEENTLSVHSLNRAIAVLIAKVDRFYSQVCRELCLPALLDLCVAIVSSSENRIFYSQQKHIHLTASVSLLSRISDIISSLSHRPLIHQMFIYPLVSSHFVKVCQCGEQESRIAATALAEVATRLLVVESAGLCFNQTLILPFQTATCSEGCSDETKEQLLCSLSSLVLSQADKIGSGWKPLFGSLKAVSASGDEKVHWCSIDVISSYLRIDTPNVLSSSILECIPCVVNLLQNSEQDEITQAALRLLPSIYSLILYLYSTPHVPNYHLLHRSDLRSKCLEEVDGDAIEIEHGPLPWDDKQTYEIASVELFLSFLEKMCGTLLTSNSSTQKNLLDMIGRLLIDIATKPLAAESGGVGMSAVVLPYVQKWIRRTDVDNIKILKQVIGACTQIVIDMVELDKFSTWKDRLIRDICSLFVECVKFDKTCAVAPAYFTLLAHNSKNFTTRQWLIYSSYLSAASTLSLRHIRLLNSYFVRGSRDENGDIGSVTAFHPANLKFQQFLMAVQVFSSKRGMKKEEENEEEEEEKMKDAISLLMLSHGAETHRIEISSIVSCLLTHCLLIQLIASILLATDDHSHLKCSLIGQTTPIDSNLDSSIYPILYSILDSSSEVCIDFDNRPAIGSLISKMIGIEQANLLKPLVVSNLIKSLSLLRRKNEHETAINEVIKMIVDRSRFLKDIEFEVSTRRSALVAREHAITQYHLVPVENGEEHAYRLVSNTFVDDTVSEYEKHRDRLKPDTRKNPFLHQKIEETSSENDKLEEDFDEIRLAAYRDICTIPLRQIIKTTADSDNMSLLKPAFQHILQSSPDLSIRQLVIQYIDRILSQ